MYLDSWPNSAFVLRRNSRLRRQTARNELAKKKGKEKRRKYEETPTCMLKPVLWIIRVTCDV
jgi:hypothetical protein